MSYRYDVFLSYSRKFPYSQWVDDIFYPLFVPYLEDAINRSVSIFKDTEAINTGSSWPQRLREALCHCRCMVSVFTPSYFRSEWCVKEFSTMHFRQKELGFLTVKKPEGLIIPINLFDGEHFPDCTRNLHMLNCIKFNRVGEGMKNNRLYIDLQGELQKWVYDVASVINNAPPWDGHWLSPEWLDNAENHVQATSKVKARQPAL